MKNRYWKYYDQFYIIKTEQQKRDDKMAEASDKQGMLLQNLKDAGCSQEMIQKCMEYVQEQEEGKLFKTLALHKQTLLDMVHICHEKIDCLDYLVYWLKKEQKQLL